MTVFVVQDSPGKNLLPAASFGDLFVLSPAGDRPFSTENEIRRVWNRLHERKFCENDYILPIGDPVLIGVTMALAAEITLGKFKVLKYDRQERRYFPIELDLKTALEEE